MFDIILIVFIVFVTIVSIVKTFEILKYANRIGQEQETIRTRLYSEIEIQSSLKSRVELLDKLNASMFARITFIINELMDFQKGLLSNNTDK